MSGYGMATQSGLAFFAVTQDFYLRAFDIRTGAEVWKTRLPVASQGRPMTDVSPRTGRPSPLAAPGNRPRAAIASSSTPCRSDLFPSVGALMT